MKMTRGYWIVTFAGVGIYMAAAFAPIVISPYFWTSHTISSEVPWYFMGNAFISRLSRRSVVSEGDDHPTIAD